MQNYPRSVNKLNYTIIFIITQIHQIFLVKKFVVQWPYYWKR